MATVHEMFTALLTLDAGKTLEVPGVVPQTAEYLRQQFVKKLGKYRTELDILGVPKEAQPQSLRMDYDHERECAVFSIGERRTKRLDFSFNIPTSNEQATPPTN